MKNMMYCLIILFFVSFFSYRILIFLFFRFFNIFYFSDKIGFFWGYFSIFLHKIFSSDSVFLYKKVRDDLYLLHRIGDITTKHFNLKFFSDDKIKILEIEPFQVIFISIKLFFKIYFIIEINLKKNLKGKNHFRIKTLIFFIKITINILEFIVKILSKIFFHLDVEVLKYISTIISIKYNIMEKHSKKTVCYCKKLLSNIDFTKYNIVDISKFKKEMILACYLHDLGKIGIEDKILNKVEPLTKEEWDIIKRHPIIGYDIVSKVFIFEYIPNIVLYHHERFDGNGYPEGLLGEKIPVEARMFSIIDAFDSMISNREYKKTMTKKEALIELKKERGKQFDPFFDDVFCKYLEKTYDI